MLFCAVGLSCRVVSCRVVSCRVVSCRVVSCRVVSCRVVSCRIVSYRIVSYRIVSYLFSTQQLPVAERRVPFIHYFLIVKELLEIPSLKITHIRFAFPQYGNETFMYRLVLFRRTHSVLLVRQQLDRAEAVAISSPYAAVFGS